MTAPLLINSLHELISRGQLINSEKTPRTAPEHECQAPPLFTRPPSRRAQTPSAGHVRPGPRQLVEPIHRLACRPGDAAQQHDAEERIVEGPGIVAGDRHENAAL